jgi:hypothetical protein
MLIEPDPSISAMVKVVLDFILTLGLTFHPCPRSREALDPVPCCGHSSLAFFSIEVFRTYTAALSIRQAKDIAHVNIDSIELLLCLCRDTTQQEYQQAYFSHCNLF